MHDVLIKERPFDHTALLRLNRPESHNALDINLLQELEKQLDLLHQEDIRVLIITGAGNSFSSGADLKQIKTFDADQAREFSLAGHRVFEKLENFPCPVIAAVNGYALGGGCELACACDLRYAATSAKLGQPESRVGMVPGWGGTFRLPRYIGVAKAKELVFTGRMLTATEAAHIGLVNAVFPDDQFMEQVTVRSNAIASNAPIANRLSKKMLNRYPYEIQPLIDEESLALSHCVTTDDQTEAIDAFLEKRAPVFRNR